VNKNPKIENLDPFKKGESGNPKGRPRKLISETIKELEAEGVQQTTTTEIKAVYLMLINLTIPELENRVKDQKQSALVRIVGKAILSGKGFEIIERMLDRTLGKPTQPIEADIKDDREFTFRVIKPND
jgi:hypothetical protein